MRKFILVAAAFALSACSTPGGAGFTQLHRENVAEKRVLKAAAVHTQNISKHVERGLKLTDDLAHMQLTEAQAKELSEIRVEFNAVKLENTGLVQQLATARDIVVQRDATIAQTKAEVNAAARESWWEGIKLRGRWLLGGLALGIFLHGIILAGWLASKVWFKAEFAPVTTAVATVEKVV